MHSLLQQQLAHFGLTDRHMPPDLSVWKQFLDSLDDVYQQMEQAAIYHALFEQSNDAVFILDMAGTHLVANQKAADLLGYTLEEIVGLSFREVVAPTEIDQSQSIRDRLVAGESIPPYERHFRHKNGSLIPVEINVALVRESDGTPLYIQSVVRDISARKRSEDLLHASFELYRILARSLPNLTVLMVDHDLCHLLAEGAALERHGHNNETLIGQSIYETLPPERSRLYEPLYRAALRGEESTIDLTVNDFTYHMTFAPVRDENGIIIAALVLNEDITERKRAADALRLSEANISALINNTRDAIYSLDTDLRIITVNQSFRQRFMRAYGAPPETDTHILDYLSPEVAASMRELYQRVLNGESFRVERHFSMGDDTAHVEVSFSPIIDQNGTITGISAVSHDITERKQAEEALRLSESRFRRLISDLSVGIIVHEADTTITLFNNAALNALGLTEDQLLGKTSFDPAWNVIHEDGSSFPPETHPVSIAIQTLLPVRDVVMGVYHPRSDERAWLLVSANPELDAAGNLQRVIVTFNDISERRRMEDQLRYQAALVEQINDAVYSTDINERIITWNAACERLYGWTAAQAIGQFSGKMVGSHLTGEIRRRAVKQIIESGYWQDEIFHTHRDGTLIHVQISTARFTDASGAVKGFVAVSRDITERRRMEDQLRYQATLVDQINDAIFTTDLNLHVVTWNRSAERIYGWTAAEAIGQFYGDLVGSPLTDEQRQQAIRQLQQIGHWDAELRHIRRDGTRLFVHVSTALRTDASGNSTGFIVICRDITIRKQAEAALRVSEERYRDLFEGIDDAIFVHDMDANILDVNEAACRRLGYSRDELLRMKTTDIDAPEYAARFAQRLRQQVKQGSLDDIQGLHITRDGRRIYLLVNSKIIDYRGQAAVLAVARDITPIKEAEQQAAELAAKASAVETLRRLLGHIAHDLRTPLSVMTTSLYLLRRKYGELIGDLRYIDNLDQQVNRMTYIVDDVVTLALLGSDNVEMDFRPVQLNQVIGDMMTAQGPLIQQKGHTIQLQLMPELPVISMDTSWMVRVLQYLLDNALHYTPSDGTITLRTKKVKDGVTLEIADTGIGMSPEEAAHVFEPFYRADIARSADKGGLGRGLPIVEKVIQAHGGQITVESVEGQGTTFHIWLPVQQ